MTILEELRKFGKENDVEISIGVGKRTIITMKEKYHKNFIVDHPQSIDDINQEYLEEVLNKLRK